MGKTNVLIKRKQQVKKLNKLRIQNQKNSKVKYFVYINQRRFSVCLFYRKMHRIYDIFNTDQIILPKSHHQVIHQLTTEQCIISTWKKASLQFESAKNVTIVENQKINSNLQLKNKLANQQNEKQNKRILQFMSEMIKWNETQIFYSLIISIQESEVQPEKAILHFETVYPTITYKKKQLQNIVGQTFYNIKKKQFNSSQQKICHFCQKKIQEGQQGYQCQEKMSYGNSFSHPISYYYRYRKNYYGKLQFTPMVFYQPSQSILCCRYQCNRCANHICKFCDFKCECQRCLNMRKLVMMLSHYYELGGDVQKLMSQFKLKFNTKQFLVTNQEQSTMKLISIKPAQLEQTFDQSINAWHNIHLQSQQKQILVKIPLKYL